MNFIYVSAAYDYVSFDWIGINEEIQLKVIYLSEKLTTNVWTIWVLKFSGIFFAKIYKFISSDQLIYIRWCLLRFESLYRAIPSCRQDHSGNPDRGIYPPTIGWSIELFFISSVPRSRLNKWLPQDWGKYLLELCQLGSPYHHSGHDRSTFTQQLQQISHHREIRNIRCPDAQWWKDPESEFRFQCCAALDYYGDNLAHATWRLSPCHSDTTSGWGDELRHSETIGQQPSRRTLCRQPIKW
jgi:hypothetical protein